ncbi:TetR/AcrR family transcriptional regulator [Streptomyces sp. NPDC005438]|uniref:TetR/AcrR family transcriptional regulator n=1 Tax=Streptomyces sp. NPDC005438 TaxID=3156880 RepID=UPI0033BC0F5D
MTTEVRRRMDVGARRQQLIGVALELFSKRSPEEVSIDDIATAAGISRPLIYHYFPGKHSLYEAAVRAAADELASRFQGPLDGPLSFRLLVVMDRYFDFVTEHGPGFAALLRGGPAAGSGRTTAVIEEVRGTAYTQFLRHLRVESPGPRLSLVLRSWVGLAETTALIWLDQGTVPRAELERQLVQDFWALAAVTATADPETARVMREVLRDEPADSPFRELSAHLAHQSD